MNLGTNVANPDVKIPSDAPASTVNRKGGFLSRAKMTLGNCLIGNLSALTEDSFVSFPLCISDCLVLRIFSAAAKYKSNSYTMACALVRGDNPLALMNGLSSVLVDKHGIIILYQLLQCRPCPRLWNFFHAQLN